VDLVYGLRDRAKELFPLHQLVPTTVTMPSGGVRAVVELALPAGSRVLNATPDEWSRLAHEFRQTSTRRKWPRRDDDWSQAQYGFIDALLTPPRGASERRAEKGRVED
jgi:hypothetical protein